MPFPISIGLPLLDPGDLTKSLRVTLPELENRKALRPVCEQEEVWPLWGLLDRRLSGACVPDWPPPCPAHLGPVLFSSSFVDKLERDLPKAKEVTLESQNKQIPLRGH